MNGDHSTHPARMTDIWRLLGPEVAAGWYRSQMCRDLHQRGAWLLAMHMGHGVDQAGPVPADGVFTDALGSDRATCLTGVTLLVVEDEPDARELLKTLLEGMRADVIAVASAAEGLRQLQSRRVHLILSDIGMPGMDGYEFMRQVRLLPAGEGGMTPAVALTAFAGAESRELAMQAGYHVHVAKPYEVPDLLQTIDRLRQKVPA